MTIDRDLRIASALGALSPVQEAEVQAALAADPTLQAERQADLEALALLLDDLDLDRVQVPPDAAGRLMQRVRAEASAGSLASPAPALALAPAAASPLRPRPAWWLTLPLGLAAALALFFALRPPTDPLSRYAGAPGAVSRQIQAGGEPVGTLVRLADGRVFVHLTRRAPTGRTFQLWQIAAGQPASLGVFGAEGLLIGPLPAGTTVAVSEEPAGGSPQPTTQPLFAQSI